MTVPDPGHFPSAVPQLTNVTIKDVTISTVEVETVTSYRYQESLGRRSPPAIPIPLIHLDGFALPLLSTVTILGMEIDNSLSFTTHVKKTAANATSRIGCVRRVSHLTDTRRVTNLYTAQVRSV
ncbi:hypothetical protein E2C01_031057 [Portunus trituberculatus]|uniref:Uncharacterized protein n=1 Tax=Portunus trituberculatus TaxID=210409 RepID=A0A5B7ESL1_PORTR|nr:hypothetical protein [Portunus trituberculatus]